MPQLAALETKDKFNTEKLEIEAKKAEESEKKVAEMQIQMAKMQEQLIKWQIEVATRQSEANMNEVGLFSNRDGASGNANRYPRFDSSL